jgi:hypothetical protein
MEKLEQSRTRKQATNCNAPKNSQGKAWRTRAASHKANLLALLRERGELGVESAELYADHSRFGVSPRNRCSELRKAGHNIQTIFLSHGLVKYVLREGPQTGQRRAPVVPQKSTTDDLPLFAGVG